MYNMTKQQQTRVKILYQIQLKAIQKFKFLSNKKISQEICRIDPKDDQDGA